MTIDTNIIIGYIAGDKSIVETINRWLEQGQVLFVPAVVEAEVLSFSSFTEDERAKTERFIDETFLPVAFDRTVARIAGRIRAVNKIELPDASIAATALFTSNVLVTRNTKDFSKIFGLTVLNIK